VLGVSERQACQVLGQHRSVQRYAAQPRDDEDELTKAMISLASQYGRYGYRRIAALLRRAGWKVNDKRVERIWRQEGLKVPQKQPKRGRIWLTDGSCIRLRPEYPNHVWAYDFVQDRTHDGKAFRMLTIVDEYSRECLDIVVERKLNSFNVIDAVADLIIQRGTPAHIRSDNGP
jgi:putative transposase